MQPAADLWRVVVTFVKAEPPSVKIGMLCLQKGSRLPHGREGEGVDVGD